ncbi:retrovirus-related Pol polyprotein from transposon 17.6 [Trichonephila clavipes]|nr:retrovirus-related Pol polyprotein from transposon 17.6 [Trichonephila clavipes]
MLHRVIREDQRNWDQQILFLLFAYREVPNTTTGASPFRLIYDREAPGRTFPIQLLITFRKKKMEKSASLTASQKQKVYGDYFNKMFSVKNFSIVEQVVLLIPDSTNVIYARMTRPGEIIQHHPLHSYKVKLPDGIRSGSIIFVHLQLGLFLKMTTNSENPSHP